MAAAVPGPAPIAFGDSHSVGGKLRVRPGSVALLCRWPHDRQIAPTSLMSASLDISFSRTAIEPATTGRHTCHKNKRRGADTASSFCVLESSIHRLTPHAGRYQVDDQ